MSLKSLIRELAEPAPYLIRGTYLDEMITGGGEGNQVLISIENITAEVLAHEIAHAVINFHFNTPPPARMQEILAQYVDKHLWEE